MKKIIKWLDNFWYHYRWMVLIGGSFVVAIVIMTFQMVTKDDYDMMLLYTGPEIPNANETLEIENAFKKIMDEDYDGDGKLVVSMDSLFLLTDEQLEDDSCFYDDEGNPIYINTSDMVTTKQQFSTQMFVGEALICLLDPAWYDLAREQDAFVPLNELIDELPEDTYDECALYLNKTEFGKYFTACNALPEDTVICFRRMSSTTALKDKEEEERRYEYNKQVFINLLNFSVN